MSGPDPAPTTATIAESVATSSTHELAGSLTQSAMLHLGEGPFADTLEPLFQRVFHLTQSTSASALLLTSLDMARQALVTALREDGWIMGTTGWDPCDRLLTWACAQEGFEPVHVMRTDDYGVLQGFVAAGIGVALVPRLGLGSPRDDIAVRPIEGRALARQIGVAKLRTSPVGSADRLLAELRQEAERIQAEHRGPGLAPTVTFHR